MTPVLDQVGRVAATQVLAAIEDRALGDLAALGMQQARDRLERGRLARAVAAQQRGDPPLGTVRLTPFSTRMTWL
jgi:hypothetical protein